MKTDKRDASYYRLHTGAVDDLVNASPENTPQYSKEELEKYTSHRGKKRLKPGVKIYLIKAWFYGAVCFFVFWGMGLYVSAQLDLYVIAAILMGMVTDLLINTLLRFMERRGGESRRFMMITRMGAAGFALNILYGGALLFLVVTAYTMINMALRILFGSGEGAPFLGVEPLLFGVFATAADTLLIACKNVFSDMLKSAKRG